MILIKRQKSNLLWKSSTHVVSSYCQFYKARHLNILKNEVLLPNKGKPVVMTMNLKDNKIKGRLLIELGYNVQMLLIKGVVLPLKQIESHILCINPLKLIEYNQKLVVL